ncbi:hypothetical protein ATG66_2615 [Vibrio sp. ES.051]|nr:hypothetical protein ATG66_2615 [Vibrio sp. ES.051]
MWFENNGYFSKLTPFPSVFCYRLHCRVVFFYFDKSIKLNNCDHSRIVRLIARLC